jgi:hypothetical protein
MTNDISQPEEDAGYRTITFPYHGNTAFGRSIRESERMYKHIDVLRVFQDWAGTTVVYKKLPEREL